MEIEIIGAVCETCYSKESVLIIIDGQVKGNPICELCTPKNHDKLICAVERLLSKDESE